MGLIRDGERGGYRLLVVTAFIDLTGVSGAVYRFRKVEGQRPPTGGNFVYARSEDDGLHVVCCGMARTLAGPLLQGLSEEGQSSLVGADLYIRLNVSSGVRESEHADLMAGLPQPVFVAAGE